jgi:Putative transposase/Transposase zinc-binding domain
VPCPADTSRRGRRARFELAEIFRQYGSRLPPLSHHQARTLAAITNCRTAALGGHLQQCDRCGHQEISYNSCRNRHCPKCQGLDEVRWLERQQQSLLPIEYHHVVFTIPDGLHPLLRSNPRVGYALLFRAVAETLHDVALRPKNLGARIGFTAILHTWTQTLAYHPHLHCIVTGGGLSSQGDRWVAAKPGFLFPVRILSRVFRGKFLQKLEQALDAGTLRSAPSEGHAFLRRAARKNWVVYSKPPFAGPEQVLRYLARYTHRIALSNDRLESIENGKVSFRWRDRAHGNQPKLMTLAVGEFLRRFLLHLLPPGFVRIRHYGLLANASRKASIPICKQLLDGKIGPAAPPKETQETWQELLLRLTGVDATLCPQCRNGHLRILRRLSPLRPSIFFLPSSRAP